jgi:hypothetical protein
MLRKIKICYNCGCVDNVYWRHSRFDYNADYMRYDQFQNEYPMLSKQLENRRNHDPVEDEHYYYYRRGTGGIEVYRVWKPDYKMPRERFKHKGLIEK